MVKSFTIMGRWIVKSSAINDHDSCQFRYKNLSNNNGEFILNHLPKKGKKIYFKPFEWAALKSARAFLS